MHVDTDAIEEGEGKDDGEQFERHGDERSEAREGGRSLGSRGRETTSASKEASTNKRQKGAPPLTLRRASTGGERRANESDEGIDDMGGCGGSSGEDMTGTGGSGERGDSNSNVNGYGQGPPRDEGRGTPAASLPSHLGEGVDVKLKSGWV